MEAGAGSVIKSEAALPDSELPEVIPFQLGASINLRCTMDPAVKAKTTLVGVIPNIALLVEDPVFSKDNQIAGRVGGEIVCGYFLDGYLFTFKSRFGQVLIHDIVCIDYPKHFEAKQLRKHPRIKVHLEAESVIGDEGKLINGDIVDVSQSGCCLQLPGIIALSAGTPVSLTFVLPNDEQIEDLGCTVMNLRHIQNEKTTMVGLALLGPGPELAKVKRFCDMCSYFRL